MDSLCTALGFSDLASIFFTPIAVLSFIDPARTLHKMIQFRKKMVNGLDFVPDGSNRHDLS
jgi:hypothetical protein